MKLEHVLGAAFIIIVLALVVGCEVKVWRECRAGGNSFVYCWKMVSIGPPLFYSFDPIGDNGGLMGPNAGVDADGKAYWMGEVEFLMATATAVVVFIPLFNNATLFCSSVGPAGEYG